MTKTRLSAVHNDFYRAILRVLNKTKFPFLVGGAFALRHYSGVIRDTKDLDLFVRPADAPGVLRVMAEAGHRTELTADHWIGKIWGESDTLVDIIFSSGNGLCAVDGEWFSHAARSELFGSPILFMPPEEMIWSKAYILERERFDGADIAHLMLARGATLDWERLLRRFGDHWRVLLSHIVLFDFSYPSERLNVPSWVRQELLERARRETVPENVRVCRGTLLSRAQYKHDIENGRYEDARLPPWGTLTEEGLRQ